MAFFILLLFFCAANNVYAGSNMIAYAVDNPQELEGLPCRKDGIPDFMCIQEENLSAILTDCQMFVSQLLIDHNRRTCELEVVDNALVCRKSCPELDLQFQELSEHVKTLYGALSFLLVVLVAFVGIWWWTDIDDSPLKNHSPLKFYRICDLMEGLTSPIPLPRNLCTGEEACKKIRDNEYQLGNSNNINSCILTFAPASNSGTEFLFLLVPVNTSTASASKVKLFGEGGAFTSVVEVARDLARHHLLDARLVVVLYERGGLAFSTKTLGKLNMTARELAYEALPKDSSVFPSHDEVHVLWRDEDDDLRVCEGDGPSLLSDLILAQKWAMPRRDIMLGELSEPWW